MKDAVEALKAHIRAIKAKIALYRLLMPSKTQNGSTQITIPQAQAIESEGREAVDEEAVKDVDGAVEALVDGTAL